MFYVIIIFILGLAVGSFINVAVFRTREQMSFIKPRSKCFSCLTPIAWYDLIPVVSFIALRRRCRKCKSVFSWQYPLIELVTGLVFVFLFLRYSLGWFLPVEFVSDMVWLFMLRDAVLFTFLLIIFVYDFKYLLVLDRFSIPAMVVVLIMNLFLGVSPFSMIVGLAVIAGFFALQYFISKGKWVGGGDMRIGAIMGLALGIEKGLLALFIAYVIGAFVAIIMLSLKKAGLKSQISFGPFLTAATFFVLIFGDWIIDWYLTISNFV